MVEKDQENSSIEKLINFESVRLLYSHATTANIVNLSVAIVLVFVQWPVVPHRVLLSWFGFIVLISLFRLGQSYLFHHSPQHIEKTDYWKNWYIFTTCCSALGWGSAGILLFSPGSMAHQMFLAYVLAGIAAGGMATLSMVTWTYLSHLLLVLLPITLYFFIMADTIHIAMGILAVFYILLLLRTARSMQETLVDSLKLGFQNSDLVDFLSETKKEAEQLNEELKVEILEKKKGEKILKESEEKYRMLIEIMPQAIVIIQDRKPVFANPVALEIFGFDKTSGISGLDMMNLVQEQEKDRLSDFLKARVSRKTHVPDHYFTVLKRFSGIEFPAEIFARRIPYGGKSAVQLIITDISDRKKMEEEVLKARKLESIGVFAGGIAHDFNNLLTGILGNVTLAKAGMSQDNKNYQWLEEARKASCRAKDLTQQLLTFSKGGNPVKKTASVVNLIKDSSLFVLGGSNVKCKFSISPDLWPVEVDEGQFTQVINNLVINADQAMPEGGVIKVTAENSVVKLESGLPLVRGNYIKISIQDQGQGVPDKYQANIFDPYFSTKTKGSGLGLAICYSIIRNHGGGIILESKSGEGATFVIYLPALPGKKVRISGDEKQKQYAGSGSGCILVVDDEEMIRKVLGEILNHLGFETICVEDGAEALEFYQKAVETNYHISAVILDLTIPGGMGGKETINKLLKINQEAKVIVSSGYSNDPIMADYRNYGFSGVVTKPFDVDEIGEVLHDILGEDFRQA